LTDEKNEEARTWENLPPRLKTIVYATLREAAARYTRDAAQAGVLQSLVTDDAPGVCFLEETNLLIKEAFQIAIDDLMIGDPDICSDCGDYHDEDDPPMHEKKKEDLS
jgi:hypothetical protein